MSRWTPGARERLQQAAFELIAAHGYDAVTVAGIAERAGLTERTFFRHFSDKREALFGGSERLVDAMVAAIDAAPPASAPLAAIRAAVEAVARDWSVPRALARARTQMIAAHPDLRERELIKRAALTAAVAQALRRRDVPEPAATLAAEAGIAVFFVSFARWIDDAAERAFVDVVRADFAQLAALAHQA